MSILKKASAGLVCAAMTATLASCSLGGPDSSYAAVIDGEKIPAGIFIAMQYDAYYNALFYTDPAETAVTTAAGDAAETAATTAFADKTIEGKAVREWINDEATAEMQKYAAVENKFDELGLVFADNEPKQVELYMESLWDYYGEMYEGFGVAQSSMSAITLNSEKKNLIFNHYYGEGGERAVSEDEIRQYLTDNYARINCLEIQLRDSDGNLLKSEAKADMQAKAEEYLERAKGGEDFNNIIHEYQNSLNPAGETAAAADDDHSTHGHETVISKTGMVPNQEVVEKVFSGTVPAGEYFLLETANSETIYVVQCLDLFADETYYETNHDSALYALKGEEFEAEVESWTSAQTVERNQAAYDRYTYEKFESLE